MNRIRKMLLIVLSILFIFSVFLFSWIFLVTKDSNLEESKLITSSINIQLFDENGERIKETASFEGTNIVKGESLNEYTKDAFISIEDKRFYNHNGLDYKRILAATLHNIKSRSFKEGASTISQQLIKNTHLTGEKTIRRKLKEIKLTRQLEKKYSKDQILEMYLNSIYFGHSCFGISSAAEYYFGKTPADLDIAESAMLGGIIKSPNHYSPFKDRKKCKQRRDAVIEAMYKQGYITKTEKIKALNTDLPVGKNITETNPYIDEALSEAEKLLDDEIFYSDLKIYTFLNPNIQNYIANLKDEYESDKIYMIGDNATHGIKAYYTSLKKEIRRQPGSTVKPLLVYAPAIEEKLICPATPVNDEKIDINGYSPSNFNGTYSGYISARQALVNSVNVPAVKILNSLGIKKSCEYAEKLDLTIREKDQTLALALGGMSEGFTLRELLSAYGTFSNKGNYMPYRFIRKIESNQKVLYEQKNQSRKVFSDETVSLINDMLCDTATKGTAKKLNSLPYAIYAKTGTSGSKEKNIDAYTISYTSSDTIAVWLGKEDNTPIETTGGGVPCLINKKIAEYLYKDSYPKEIKKSNKIVNINIDKNEYLKNHKIIEADDNAPKKEILTECFSVNNKPQEKSSRFTFPTICRTPQAFYRDNTIYIILCQTEYIIYDIKRTDQEGNVVLFPSQKGTFIDTQIQDNSIYTYTITPKYKENKGKSYTIPSIKTKIKTENNIDFNLNNRNNSILDSDWWNE